MTGGKDVILCEALVFLKENETITGKIPRVSMTSKYLKGNALLEIMVIKPFKPLLQDFSFAPIARTNLPGNNTTQTYLFHSEDQTRSVYCEEYGLETRISVDAVIAFLDHSDFPQFFIGKTQKEPQFALAVKSGVDNEDKYLQYKVIDIPFEVYVRKNENGFDADTCTERSASRQNKRRNRQSTGRN